MTEIMRLFEEIATNVRKNISLPRFVHHKSSTLEPLTLRFRDAPAKRVRPLEPIVRCATWQEHL
jgi:hypothetical protein